MLNILVIQIAKFQVQSPHISLTYLYMIFLRYFLKFQIDPDPQNIL